MFGRFLPKTTSFFDFFERHSAISIEVCAEFQALTQNPAEVASHASRIKELERQADDVTHKCIEALHKTFITPIERGDIHSLMKRLDDIVDSIDSVASRMALYELTVMRPEAHDLADLMVKSTAAIDKALKSLRHLDHDADTIRQQCIAIYDYENQGDALLRAALGRLFKEEKDAVMVIKWKEIYERLEKATDRCEAVANIIQGVAIEAS